MGGMGGGAERFAAAGIAAAMPALAAGVAASLAPPVAATALFALTAANFWVDRGAGARPPMAAALALLAFLGAAGLAGAFGLTGALGAALILWRTGAEAHAAARRAQDLGAADGPWPAWGFYASAAIGLAWLAAQAPTHMAGLALPPLPASAVLAGLAITAALAQIAAFAAQRWTARQLGERLSPRSLYAGAWMIVLPPLLALPVDPAAGLAALAAWRLAMRLAETPSRAPSRALA